MMSKEKKEKSFVSSLFSGGEENLSEEEKKKNKYEESLKTNPFIKKKSVDPKNGDKRFLLFRDSMSVSIEESYYWVLRFIKGKQPVESFRGKGLDAGGFGLNALEVYKLKDVFDASVSSSFHGQIGSKISAVQQQVTNTLSQIGQLTKSLFPIVREIRIMDERLEFYRKSFSKEQSDEARQNEVALKSTWIEVVEQGMQNPNSVYSMATKLGFITLPDLFFSINPHGETCEEQRKRLSKLLEQISKEHELNDKVRNALEKKLIQYYTWKEKTHIEMQHTWKFRIKNLRQHYNVIRLYMSWLKPYLTTLKQLQMKQDEASPDIVGAFETSKLELELVGDCLESKSKKYHGYLLVRMTYVTRPEMSYTQSGQRQPVHCGRMDIEIEPYVATKEEFEFYKEHTDKEALKYFSGEEVNMIKDIEEAMKSLGEDVEGYLREAETGTREKKEEKKKEKSEGFFDPFTALIDGFKELLPEFKTKNKNDGEETWQDKIEKEEVQGKIAGYAWNLYDIYKKGHGLFTP